MSEAPTPNPNQSSGHEDLRPFSELLERPEIVYHGIGGDLIALNGIAIHGLTTTSRQLELTGSYNSNTPRDAAWNSDDKVSVAKAPQPGLPNPAFMEYIENRPISFAIDSRACPIEEPAARGLYDEAFIKGAPDEVIVGIVLDANTIDKPVTEIPVVGHITPADKARGFMAFLIEHYDAELEANLPGLEGLIDRIEYSTNPFMGNNNSLITNANEQSVDKINGFLKGQLESALQKKFGRTDQTVLEMVRQHFPSKPLYLNSHDNGFVPYTEHDYFETLPDDAVIGYEVWDGSPDAPSLYEIRRAIKAARGELPKN